MLIKDVTTPNPEFLLVNDVRLSQYPADPQNLALARAYQWTDLQLSPTELPSVRALEAIVGALQFEGVANRLVLRATYGHGKSHLALALANFFGQPAGSEEVQAVLAGVRHVAEAKAARMESFKQDQPIHLVLRLMGGEAESLSAMVLRGLETALRENPATANADLGLWFDKAIEFLNELTPAEQAEAKAWLEPHGLDIGALRATLVARDSRHRELTRKLASAIRRVPVDFGLSRSPGQMLEHVGREFCGPGKPFAGIVVLFDEFAAFVEAYAREYGHHSDSLPLQSLLDGVQSLKHRAVFVAFAQQDPDDAAALAMADRGASQPKIADLKKELTRLPLGERWQLYSPMEAVLDAYLKQDRNRWDELTPEDSVADNDVQDGVDAVRTYFPNRYTDANNWTLPNIYKTLAFGCHPLHPLTTAILCNADIKATTGGSRTVLAFVEHTVETFLNRKALADDKRLTWVYPVELVRYYQRQIAEDVQWQRYDDTRRKVVTANIPDATDVVEGMLLYEVAGFKPDEAGDPPYDKAIAALTGLPRTRVKRALELCEKIGYIEYDSQSELYRFPQFGQDIAKAKQAIANGVADLRKSESAVLRTISERIKVKKQEVTFQDEHQGDWAACVHVVPRAQWSVEKLKALVRPQMLDASGKLADASRGYVLMPLAVNDEDILFFEQNAQADLDKLLDSFADKQTAPPMMVVVPQSAKPHKALVQSALEWQALEGLSQQDKRNLGDGAYQRELEKITKAFQKSIETLEAEISRAAVYKVPAAYQGTVETRLKSRPVVELQHILTALYDSGYFRHVKYLSDGMRATNLKEAVGLAVTRLYKGSFLDWADLARTRGRAKMLGEVLRNPVGGWGVIDPSERVVEPKSSSLRPAWAILEAAVPPGSEGVGLREAMLKLLNAPYGYDSYSVGLLFAAWCGVHRRELTFRSRGMKIEPARWLGTTNDFRQILETMLITLDVHVTRRNVAEAKGQIEEILSAQRYGEKLSLEDAEAALQDLKEYAGDESGDDRLREEATAAAGHLELDVKQAQAFETKMNEFQEQLEVELAPLKAIPPLAKILQTLRGSELPLGRVHPPSKVNLATLEKRISNKLRQALTDYCNTAATLQNISGYDLMKSNLDSLLQKVITPLSEPDLERRIKDAQAALEARHDELMAESRDSGIREKASEAKRANTLAVWRELLAYFEQTTPQAASTVPVVEQTVTTLRERVTEAETWLAQMQQRCAELVDPAGIKQFSRELDRRAVQFEGAPESDQLKMLDRTVDRVLSKLLDELADISRERPKIAEEVRDVVRRYERLANREGLSETQIAYVRQRCTEFEQRFAEQRQRAAQRLDDLIAANERGDEPAPLLAAVERELDFLADEEKPRRTQLEKALKKRIAGNRAAIAEKAFMDIEDKTIRIGCLERLFATFSEAEKATCLERLSKL